MQRGTHLLLLIPTTTTATTLSRDKRGASRVGTGSEPLARPLIHTSVRRRHRSAFGRIHFQKYTRTKQNMPGADDVHRGR
jgi:hypothetical protein